MPHLVAFFKIFKHRLIQVTVSIRKQTNFLHTLESQKVRFQHFSISIRIDTLFFINDKLFFTKESSLLTRERDDTSYCLCMLEGFYIYLSVQNKFICVGLEYNLFCKFCRQYQRQRSF